MIQELTLKNFKSFGGPPPSSESGVVPPDWPGEKIRFGGLSLLIGTNASGKSNIRDALRFIHGISRGYTLAEVMGEKYVEGGVLQWKGIRGGVREIVTRNGQPENTKFTIGIRTQLLPEDGGGEAEYSITVDIGDKSRPPLVADEWLKLSKHDHRTISCSVGTLGKMVIEIPVFGSFQPDVLRVDRPGLTQIAEMQRGLTQIVGTLLPKGHEPYSEIAAIMEAAADCQTFLRTISSMRFIDLDTESLRRPSVPGQTTLGDKGENLASVLQAICKNPSGKEALIAWARELTPLDVTDLKFPEVSLDGKIQLQLVEQGGREISADSASDGTLRFLAVAGAMLGYRTSPLLFF